MSDRLRLLVIACHESDRQQITEAFSRELKDGDVVFVPDGTKFYLVDFERGEKFEVLPLSEASGTTIENGYHLAIENMMLKVVKDE